MAVDAHSKWPEIHVMKTTTASKTIDVLRQIYARNGVPRQIISDNGSQFTSEQFQTFIWSSWILHTRKMSVPWHPASQGLVERFEQSFKMAIKSATIDSGSLHEKIGSFLLAYRNAPHATANEIPAKLCPGRNLRFRLDLIKPSVKDTVEKKQSEDMSGYKRLQFNTGDNVKVRDYRENSNKWTNAQVTQKTEPLSYKVQTNENNNWCRHGGCYF